jgi:Fic family protein
MKTNDLKLKIIEKHKLLQGMTIDPNVIQNLGDWLRMELTYTSNAIEGNTLTRQEAKIVSEEGISVGGKSINEILEIKNHTKALLYIQEIAKTKKTNQLTELDLLEIHRIILSSIDDINAGKYRNVPVRIAGSTTIVPNYMKISLLMDKLFNTIKNFQFSTAEALELAIHAHYELVTIHPFVDGNGRTARLLFNLILLQNQFPLSFIKKEERKTYLSSLEKAQTGGSKDDYITLMYKAVERSIDLYLNAQLNNKQEESHSLVYKIGELAKLSNEDVATIRYWTKQGLLNIFNVTKSGYSMYSVDSLSRIKQIRYLQTEKRLTLSEIKKLLD